MKLDELNDEEYSDEMQESLGNDIRWAPFVDGTRLDRTLSALEVLSASLTDQILRHGEGPNVNKEWLGRARGLRGIVLARVRQVNRLEASRVARERAWKRFAHELCEIIEDSDLAEELDEIDAPFGDITAQQWVSRRRVKRGLAA